MLTRNLTRRITQSITRAITQAGAGGQSLDSAVRALFANGEQGAWYDPSDLSTMFQDSAGTTPVTAVGQSVGRILDKSGRGNHATQATAASRPVLQQDGNGKYYLAFDGVNDFLSTGSVDFTGTDKMTVVAGVRSNANGYSNILELGTDAASSNGFAFQRGFSANGDYAGLLYGTSLGYGHTTNYVAPDTSVVTVGYNLALASVSAGEITFRRNGSVAATLIALGLAGTGNFASNPLYIGTRAGTSFPYNGNLYQLVVRGAATADLVPVETFVNSKTGAY